MAQLERSGGSSDLESNSATETAASNHDAPPSVETLRLAHKFESGSLPALTPAPVRDELDKGQGGFRRRIVSGNGSAVDNEALQGSGQQSHQRDAFDRLHFADEMESQVRLAVRDQLRPTRALDDQFRPHLIGDTELGNRAVEVAADREVRIGPCD